LDNLRQYIEQLVEDCLKEMEGATSTTAAGGEYTGKYFIGKSDISTYTKDGFTKAKPMKNSKTFDVVKFNESQLDNYVRKELINEISYRNFNENVSKITPERKITRALSEVKKRVKEIEQVIEYSARLKNENIIKKESFWESKLEQLDDLSERLHELSQNIKKLSK
jgi:spermidine/putrescine-binding protein